MSNISSAKRRDRHVGAAEGYLSLHMSNEALDALDRIDKVHQGEYAVLFLRGQALRELNRHEEALKYFLLAADQRPEDIGLLLALAWCYKRTGQLQKSIAAMELAYQADPNESIVLYNLACYLALDGNKPLALSWLGRALRMNQELRKLIPDESDFDSLRGDPDFALITSEKLSDLKQQDDNS